jgi:mannose-1-phosphate guanylyltransferase
MERPVVAVVMAGGTGTRLYPASRSDRPKQFLELGGDRTLLERAVARCAGAVGGSAGTDRRGFADATVVATGPEHADAVREHVGDAVDHVLVEPAARDTGPALAYAAHECAERYADPVLVCLPSDHVVGEGFGATAERAAAVAVETGGLVTMGVAPDRPATGYGYLAPEPEDGGATRVGAFHEKPDRETAERFVEEGFLWNAGVFAWTPGALLDAARETPLGPLVAALERGDPAGGFDAVEAVSVDHAVLERAADVYVVPAEFAWDDLGSWDALARVLDPDEDGNVALGESLTVDAADNVLAADADTHVAVVGAEDLVVAAFGDRVLVVPREQAQRVREVVALLREDGEF